MAKLDTPAAGLQLDPTIYLFYLFIKFYIYTASTHVNMGSGVVSNNKIEK